MLTLPERRAFATLFPDQKAITDILLHFACLVRSYITTGQTTLTAAGTILLTPTEFERWLLACKDQTDSGWGKEARNWPLAKLSQEVLQELVAWKMAHVEGETGLICLRPSLGRATGKYPLDYQQGDGTHGDK